jgi:hypothetical protein
MPATVTVDHPVRPEHPSACRFQVTLHATPDIHRANRGILDRALEVILVRRDAPGVRYLPKDDPRAILLPDSELPPEAPPLPPGCDAMDPGTFHATLDLGLLDGSVSHDGSARYYVFAAFADAWADPRPLFLDDPRGPLPPFQTPLMPPPRDPSATDVQHVFLRKPGVHVRFYPSSGVPRLAGVFRVDPSGPAIVTFVAQRLRPTGGVVTALFATSPQPFEGALQGEFVVPLASFLSGTEGETLRLLTFVGDELAPPLTFTVPDALD